MSDDLLLSPTEIMPEEPEQIIGPQPLDERRAFIVLGTVGDKVVVHMPESFIDVVGAEAGELGDHFDDVASFDENVTYGIEIYNKGTFERLSGRYDVAPLDELKEDAERRDAIKDSVQRLQNALDIVNSSDFTGIGEKISDYEGGEREKVAYHLSTIPVVLAEDDGGVLLNVLSGRASNKLDHELSYVTAEEFRAMQESGDKVVGVEDYRNDLGFALVAPDENAKWGAGVVSDAKNRWEGMDEDVDVFNRDVTRKCEALKAVGMIEGEQEVTPGTPDNAGDNLAPVRPN